MKKLLLFFCLSIISTIGAQANPTGLRVDYIRVPEETLIQSKTPMLSWQIAQKAVSQSAYQIMVSSEGSCRTGDMWDSGKINSDNSAAVKYSGATLQPNTTYYWKVCYWDAKGKQSRYSDIQKFTTSSSEESAKSIVSDNPMLRRNDYAVSMKALANGEYQFDFGKAAFGKVFIEYKAPKDMTLTIRAGEQLNATGAIERKPLGTIRYQEVEVELKKGESIHEALFKVDFRHVKVDAIPVPEVWGGVIMPFRYVEIAGVDEANINIKSIKPYREVMYGYREPIGSFTSSNPLLDSIWEISRYTIEATDFLGYYVDGERERIPYEADAYINQLCHYCVDAEYAIGKKTLEHFMYHPTWPTEWVLQTIIIAYHDYMYTGDLRIIEHYYDMLKAKTLYETRREDGLISSKSPVFNQDYMRSLGFMNNRKEIRDIVDWPKEAFTSQGKEMGERDSHEMMPINSVVNAFYYRVAELMSIMAKEIGKEEDSRMFAKLAEQVRATINDKLFDSERGIYIDGEGSTHASLHSNMMALALGVVDSDREKSVVEFIKSRGMACSVYGAQFLFDALYDAGEAQYALDLMTNRSDRGWYNMFTTGSTMTLEAWDIKYKSNLDWNHPWGAAPANIIPIKMWGIAPTAPAYKEAVIKPQMANLTESEITVPTLQGDIECSYRVKNGVKIYTINIPANMKANFESADTTVQMEVNGVTQSGSTAPLKVGKNTIKVTTI